MVEAFATFVKI